MKSKELGKIIRDRRKVLKLTIGELSEYTGFSRTTISDLEHGKTNPSLEVINEILKFLNMEIKIEVKSIK
ncbi:MAG: helix-turn-helix transcriptional regulator [Chitinophagales bacterium]